MCFVRKGVFGECWEHFSSESFINFLTKSGSILKYMQCVNVALLIGLTWLGVMKSPYHVVGYCAEAGEMIGRFQHVAGKNQQ